MRRPDARCEGGIACLCIPPFGRGGMFERDRIAMQLRGVARVLPGGDVHEPRVVAAGFAFGRLELLAEMGSARLFALERVVDHELGEREEIGDPERALELR